MDGYDFIAGFLIAVFIGVIGLAVWAGVEGSREFDQERARCERAGGYFMDNMRRVGKNTSHNYSCMRKDLFVDTEGK